MIDNVFSLLENDILNYQSNNSCLPTHTRFALNLMIKNFKKKFVTIDQELEDIAFKTFSDFNVRGRSFEVIISSSIEEQVISQIAFNIERSLRPLEYDPRPYLLVIADKGDFGTGSSVDTSANYVRKQSYDCLTFSNPHLLSTYKEWCRVRSNCFKATETERQSNFGCKFTPYGNCVFVPKDTSKYRMVCSEPSLDMFFQRGLSSYFDHFLEEHFKIRISEQELLQKEMARRGSLDGSLSTIDSTSASDSIYLEPLHRAGVIPDLAYLLLTTVKSRLIKYNSRTIKLSMVGTQGCGFTFSFMTLILASIVEGVYGTLGIKAVNGQNFGVYGDDVIVVSSAYDTVISCMKLLGFVPNEEKSFNIGPFRESCGGDFYEGHDVRSYYCKNLKTPQEISICFNRLMDWSIKIGFIPYDTLAYLLNEAAKFDSPSVPIYSAEDSGIRTPRLFGRYRSWEPTLPSEPLPDIHYDAKVQFAIKGYIAKGRILGRIRRDDVRKPKYKTVRRYSVSVGTPPHVRCNKLNLMRYEDTFNKVLSYYSIVYNR